ncbi:divergent AAA domain protein [bacterium BMS3Bbin09]|nr:divergent AAA domain protein [bacterium BMS3Bbin09]
MLIKEGEGLTVEFKERYTPRIDRDIVSFANSKGGRLLLGVDDRGKEPVFEMDLFFRAIFYRDPKYSLKTYKGRGKGTEETTQKTTRKTTRKIIDAITKKADITQKELAAFIGITEDGVKYHITRLKRKGILKRIGPDKGGHWEIVG